MKWPAIVFRLTSYCVVIDVALELFLHYQYSQYTSDVYFLVQRWQKVSQITGFGIAAILLFWSGLPLLRKRASWKNAPRANFHRNKLAVVVLFFWRLFPKSNVLIGAHGSCEIAFQTSRYPFHGTPALAILTQLTLALTPFPEYS